MTYVGATNWKIKDWFLPKIGSPRKNFFVCMGPYSDLVIVRETEKAALCIVDLERFDGEQSASAEVWVPKACLEDKDEYIKGQEALERKMQEGLERYAKLVEFAKANGLKVRNRMKTETIMKAISEAGLSYNG